MARTIPLVEDDDGITALLRLSPQDEGYQIVHETDGDQALIQLEKQVWDMVILDLVLPGIDDLEICRRIRQMAHYLPVIIINAYTSKMYRVLGPEMDAGDYLTELFSLLELIACAKALLHRQEAMGQSLLMDAGYLSCHGLSIDPLSREVELRGEVVDLTPRELDLLYYSTRRLGEMFSQLALPEQVQGYRHKGYEHTINTHVNRLRNKIEHDPVEPSIVLIAWGKGYKFAPMSQEVTP